MQLAFDHVVHFLHQSPPDVVSALGEQGLHAVVGGRHEAWGTHNALAYLDLSYLEFLAVRDEEQARGAVENRLIRQLLHDLSRSEGWGQVAIRTDDIEAVADRLKTHGLSVTGPLPGMRRREDGTVLSWQMLFAAEPDANDTFLPFFIQWGQSDEERRRDLTERGVIAPHPAGPLRLAFVGWAVRELDSTVDNWSRWFGLEAGERGVDASFNGRYCEWPLPGGAIRLYEPLGEGRVQEVIKTRGERPFLVALSGAEAEREFTLWGGTCRLIR